MLAKHWKKFGILVLVIACIINISYKLLKSTPIKEELSKTAAIFEKYLDFNKDETNNSDNKTETNNSNNTKLNNKANNIKK